MNFKLCKIIDENIQKNISYVSKTYNIEKRMGASGVAKYTLPETCPTQISQNYKKEEGEMRE